jgi:hypothetical protein
MARALVTKAELDQSYTYQARRSLAAGGSEPQGQSIETHVSGAFLYINSPKEKRQLNCFIERGKLAGEVVIAKPNTNAATQMSQATTISPVLYSSFCAIRTWPTTAAHRISDDRKL